jgi:hypothetical protein
MVLSATGSVTCVQVEGYRKSGAADVLGADVDVVVGVVDDRLPYVGTVVSLDGMRPGQDFILVGNDVG